MKNINFYLWPLLLLLQIPSILTANELTRFNCRRAKVSLVGRLEILVNVNPKLLTLTLDKTTLRNYPNQPLNIESLYYLKDSSYRSWHVTAKPENTLYIKLNNGNDFVASWFSSEIQSKDQKSQYTEEDIENIKKFSEFWAEGNLDSKLLVRHKWYGNDIGGGMTETTDTFLCR